MAGGLAVGLRMLGLVTGREKGDGVEFLLLAELSAEDVLRVLDGLGVVGLNVENAGRDGFLPEPPHGREAVLAEDEGVGGGRVGVIALTADTDGLQDAVDPDRLGQHIECRVVQRAEAVRDVDVRDADEERLERGGDLGGGFERGGPHGWLLVSMMGASRNRGSHRCEPPYSDGSIYPERRM